MRRPRAVRTFTDLVTPSLPVNGSTITPSFQRFRGTPSSTRNTRSPFSGCRPIFVHFPREVRVTRYSSSHRFHRCFISSCWWRQRLRKLDAFVGADADAAGIGSDANSRPMRKCAGVNGAQSWGSSLNKVRGRSLIRASNSHSTVCNSQLRSNAFPKTFLSAFFIDLTSRSQ
ncbi:hypothetical protein T06_5090 [Trichinella sp. T6]|nr:hypothetical protein T06_3682 [Trichinella sp. T6]KRX55801.1 hypothetical protein T06_9004 [Trichinella sp. T6]KRX60180.1 hypothetical protein T06_11441 [Trichinella sp. T6]KRX61651.1 hypothetical protein T06_5090 [Trichinella sp. T6]